MARERIVRDPSKLKSRRRVVTRYCDCPYGCERCNFNGAYEVILNRRQHHAQLVQARRWGKQFDRDVQRDADNAPF